MATYQTGTTAAGEQTETDPARPLTAAAPLHQPALGEDGQPCAVCDAPLASDQRYCLHCGTRRAEARVPFMEVLGAPRVRERERERFAAEAPVPAAPWYGSALGGLVALGALVLLGLGILLGTLLDGDPKPVAPVAQKPPVVNITNTGGGAAAAAPATALVPDWPEGQDGWTVQLQALPKEGTPVDAVTAARDAAAAKGAKDVGALDSDTYPSLDPGAYVIYSGVFDTKKRAARAARKLKADFPEAKVVEVSGGGTGSSGKGSTSVDKQPAKTQSKRELKKKENLSPEEYQKQQRKPQPDKLKSEGAAPKKDTKKPGAGSGATEIG